MSLPCPKCADTVYTPGEKCPNCEWRDDIPPPRPVTYLVMSGSDYYPSPRYDAARSAFSREEAERVVTEQRGRGEDWVLVFEIDGPVIRRYRMPTHRQPGLAPWTLEEHI